MRGKQTHLFIFDRQESLTQPGKRAIGSDTPIRDELSVTLKRALFQNGMRSNSNQGRERSFARSSRPGIRFVVCIQETEILKSIGVDRKKGRQIGHDISERRATRRV
jgi:hypothetical protein